MSEHAEGPLPDPHSEQPTQVGSQSKAIPQKNGERGASVRAQVGSGSERLAESKGSHFPIRMSLEIETGMTGIQYDNCVSFRFI